MASVVRLAVGRASSALQQAAHSSISSKPLLPLPPRLLSGTLSRCGFSTTSSFHAPSFTSSSLLRLSSFAPSSLVTPAATTTSLLRVAAQRLGLAATALTQVRCSHVRVSMKKRCHGCYFVRRKGRLYMECKLKPRHRQMQVMSKFKTWKEDYSEGNIKRAMFWKHARDKGYYTLGDNQFARHDWLKGKIGVTV